MNGVGENTFDAPSVVAGLIFISPILTTTSFPSLPNDAITEQILASGLLLRSVGRTRLEFLGKISEIP
jgi:hypothetical protein